MKPCRLTPFLFAIHPLSQRYYKLDINSSLLWDRGSATLISDLSFTLKEEKLVRSTEETRHRKHFAGDTYGK
jgi:hypothetical protein